jgi:Ca2+-binding RTX toxin-like protein
VIVSASDGSLADTQALSITVGNVSDGLTLTGTQQANTLTGNYEEDTIRGMGGNDTLRGLGADDVLDGGDGQDRLIGGAGADLLTGGAKADVFELEALSDSTPTASDRILDFSRSQGDKIELVDIDANSLVAGNQAFSFIGTAAFSNVAGQLRYFQQNGDTFVAGDVNGDGAADFQLVLDPLVSLISSDFML